MKKSLVLLPLAAFLLTGCMGLSLPGFGGGDSSDSSSSSSSSKPSSSSTPITPTSATTPEADLPTAHGSNFDSSVGTHTLVLDFTTDYATYKEDFPYVSSTTGLVGETLGGGIAVMTNNCFVGTPNDNINYGYLMMKNKDDYASNNGNAFIGNCVSMGTITSVTFECGAKAATAQTYDVAFYSELNKQPSSSGTQVAHPGSTVNASAGASFFKITAKDSAKNGQITKLTVVYTIS